MSLTYPKTSSVCGVQVSTWETHENGGNGMPHFFDQRYFGGNVGHAAISITIPADERGKELIKKYCVDPPIPYEKHKIRTPKAVNVNGVWKAGDETAFEEEVYVINFSWWPGKQGFLLHAAQNVDNLAERIGRHVEWAPKWKDILMPEERFHGGSVARSKFTYAPTSIIHNRGLDENQMKYLQLKSELILIEQKLQSLNILENKVNERNSNSKNIQNDKTLQFTNPSPTEVLLLNRHIPDWEEKTLGKPLEFVLKLINASIKDLERVKVSVESECYDLEKVVGGTEVKYKQDLRTLNALNQLNSYFLSLTLTKHDNIVPEEMIVTDPMRKMLEKFNETTGAVWEQIIVSNIKSGDDDLVINRESIKSILEIIATQKGPIENDMTTEMYRFEKDKSDYSVLGDLHLNLSLLLDERSEFSLRPDKEELIRKYLPRALSQARMLTNEDGQPLIEFEQSTGDSSEAEALLKIVKNEMRRVKLRIIDAEPGLGEFNQLEFQNFLTLGIPPDDMITLSLQDVRNPYGMQVEPMLQEIQRIASVETFNLQNNNCSSTVSKILEAGAPNEHLKEQFRNRALYAIANPQIVANNARAYLSALEDPKDDLLKKMNRLSPMNNLSGWMVNKLLVESNTSLLEKAAAALLVLPMGIYATAKTGYKVLRNPITSFSNLTRFAKYANSKKHVGFQVAAAVGYIPGLAITLPFAGVEYARRGFEKLFSRNQASKERLSDADFNQEQLQFSNHQLFSEVSKDITTKIKIHEIDAVTPQEAFEMILNNQINLKSGSPEDAKFTIFVLSKATEKKVLKAIQKEEERGRSNLEKLYRDYVNANNTKINKLVKTEYDKRLVERSIPKTVSSIPTTSFEGRRSDPVVHTQNKSSAETIKSSVKSVVTEKTEDKNNSTRRVLR